MRPTRILIVEDEFIVASDVQARLRALAYEVVGPVDNGPAAIEAANAGQPDLVLMDIRLKGDMDGITAAQEIRRRFQLPVVFLTAYAEDSTLQRAKASEPFGYILKPFEDRELRTVLEIALYKHRAEREIKRLNQIYAVLSQINQIIIRVQSREQLFAEACRIAAQHTGFRVVWIGWLDPVSQMVLPVGRAGESAAYLDQIQVFADERPEGRGPIGTCLRQGVPCIVNDLEADDRMHPWKSQAAAHGLRAVAALPIRLGGRICGTFTVYANETGIFQDKEVALLQEAAENISFALDRLVHDEQRRKLAEAVEQSPALIVITDAAGHIEYVNPKFTEVSGYTPVEVLGKNPRLLKSGEMPAAGYQKLWRTLLAGKVWVGEFHNRRKDGSLYWQTASISPIRDSAGTIAHFVAVAEDVTEKKLLENRYLRAQRLEGIGSLASGIAHDLNNILAPILMSAQLLQLDDPQIDRNELAQTILLSAQRGADIVKQLLSFARGKEGKKQLVQVRHLLRDIAKISRETFPRNIQVVEECDSELALVLADPTQLHQVLLNLCVNARDAMAAGGTLTLKATNLTLAPTSSLLPPQASPGPFVLLQVTDNGTGMTDSVRAHIFESFFTTKGEGEGTGLGLTTVLGIVRNHGGFITCDSVVSQGTTFYVYLPAAPATEVDPEQQANQAVIPKGRGELILIVDDEPAVRSATKRSLERHGYRVVEAHDGIEALALYLSRKDKIRAIITDYMMPRMDGIALCRTLRTLSPYPPIIVSSGGLFDNPKTETLLAFKGLGIRHILNKPHKAEVLLQALDEELLPLRATDAPEKQG